MISSRTVLALLLGANLVLGAALAVHLGTLGFEREARAQLGGAPIIQVVGGTLNGTGTVFILNQTTGDLVALQTDTGRKMEVVIDKVNVTKDFDAIK